MNEIKTGVVIRFFPGRNFGFIQTETEELFFHKNDCIPLGQAPPIGTEVVFIVGTYNGRPVARLVQPTEHNLLALELGLMGQSDPAASAKADTKADSAPGTANQGVRS
jgi:cold shock CspA family protein